MNPERFKFNVAIDDNFIIVRWERLPYATDLGTIFQYPELEMRFNYRDISKDTVTAMLRDMEVPGPLYKAI